MSISSLKIGLEHTAFSPLGYQLPYWVTVVVALFQSEFEGISNAILFFKKVHIFCKVLFPQGRFWLQARTIINLYQFYPQDIRLALQTVTDFFAFPRGDRVWIGMNDAERKDNWHWEDGSTTAYRNWLPKEPSGGSERCATMVASGQWNDIYCEIHYPMYYVCKKAHEGKYNTVPSTQSGRRHMRKSTTVPSTMYVRWHLRLSIALYSILG